MADHTVGERVVGSSSNFQVNSGDSELDEKIAEWLHLDKHPTSIAEVKKLTNEMKFDELRQMMMSPLSFGTAGLRSKMGAGFSRINDLTIIQATQGLCRYLEEVFPDLKERGVVVGFDARHNSERLAQRTSSVFASQGVPVYLFSKITPTPFVPYSVLKYTCTCGVMVTASHNPKDDNGYKVYFNNGAQIKSPHDKGISRCIEKNQVPWKDSWDICISSPLIKDPYEEICTFYFEDIKKYSHFSEENKTTKLKYTFTPMHGVGQRFAALAFEAFNLPPFVSVREQMAPDPEFPTVRYPNPEEGKSALDLAMKTANENNCSVILANDPDSDRMALAEKQPNGQWKVFTGNEIGSLFGWWAFTCHKKKHPELYPGSSVYMIASTVSSKMLQAMAREEGFQFEETLTGFKWMGNLACDLIAQGKTVLFSFEEAIGFMFGTNVFDKDGISAAVVMAEMASCLNRQGLTLTEQLYKLYHRYGVHVSNNSYYLCYSPTTIKNIFNRIRTLDSGQYPSACGPYKLSGIRDLTAGYDSTKPDNKPILPVSKSNQMITFYFENGCVATLRTSGTEPKIKYYTELACQPGDNNKSWTLPFGNHKNISRICLSPDGKIIITVDHDGRCLFACLKTKTVLHHFNFKKPVFDIKFSPCGKFIAVTHGKQIKVWYAPDYSKEFAPFTVHRTYTGLFDDTLCIDWSADSRFFVVGSRDMTGRIFSLFPVLNFSPVTLSGHRNTVIGCFFEENSLDTYTVSCDGALFCWKCSLPLEAVQSADVVLTGQENKTSIGWKKYSKHYYNQDSSAQLTTTAFHKSSHLLIAGFSTGLFTLHEVPDFILIHTLSISQQSIRTVAVNPSGEWLAFGCSSTGQLLVWEWQSETYILKQQGHYYNMNTLCYSQDGHYVATGGDDAKVKLWNMMSGFCFVTFNEHSCAVTGVVFTPNSQVVLSCSLDGTVRAFDLNRYRNFRTFTTPQAVQLSCLSVDSSGEVVCAGSLDTFEIFVWCMKTGRLIEVLSGHEGPISELVFSPSQPLLASGSWDKTVRLWNMYGSKVSWETLNLGSDVLTVSVRPDGAQVAVVSLDCQITFFDLKTGIQCGSVEGGRDLASVRRTSDKITAQSMSFAKCFTSLCYTADGKCILAGGRSKFVCIYHVDQQMLLKRFEISTNLSLDGMKEFLHSSNMTDAGPKDLIDDNDDANTDDQSLSLPGVLKGDMSSRRTLPEVRVNSLQFSPTGQSWAAACTEGLVLYSLESDIVFDPFQLDCDITPDKILQASINKEHTKALVMSLRINEEDLVCQVMEEVKPSDIALVIQSLREPYTERLLQSIVLRLEKSRHLHFYLLWCHQLLTVHGKKLKPLASKLLVMLRGLQKSVTRQQQDLDRVCSSNTYALTYILACADILQGDSMGSSVMETSSMLVASDNGLDNL